MTAIQKFFLMVLPRKGEDDMRKESEE